ncbi:MAG: hypothetical protein ACI9DC_005676, partial [Gammaproteobacteria bacterium]
SGDAPPARRDRNFHSLVLGIPFKFKAVSHW